jgi:hypothetical protein
MLDCSLEESLTELLVIEEVSATLVEVESIEVEVVVEVVVMVVEDSLELLVLIPGILIVQELINRLYIITNKGLNFFMGINSFLLFYRGKL